MLVSSILVLALGISIFSGGGSNGQAPSKTEIDFIESHLSLPGEAPGPLAKYERYYAWTVDNGKKYIYAVYIFDELLTSQQRATEHIHQVPERDMPNVSNGGCGVITFYADPRGERTPSLYCNSAGPVSFSKN
ncbi:MAG TPA: hypothetical protein VGG68_13215 [Caulobacteraceae bacterium]|jgi:hypothetical protein